MASDIHQPAYPGLPLNLEDEFRLVEIQPGKPDHAISCNLFTTRVREYRNTKLYRILGEAPRTNSRYDAKMRQEIAMGYC
jgi:hypothetical protein